MSVVIFSTGIFLGRSLRLKRRYLDLLGIIVHSAVALSALVVSYRNRFHGVCTMDFLEDHQNLIPYLVFSVSYRISGLLTCVQNIMVILKETFVINGPDSERVVAVVCTITMSLVLVSTLIPGFLGNGGSNDAEYRFVSERLPCLLPALISLVFVVMTVVWWTLGRIKWSMNLSIHCSSAMLLVFMAMFHEVLAEDSLIVLFLHLARSCIICCMFSAIQVCKFVKAIHASVSRVTRPSMYPVEGGRRSHPSVTNHASVRQVEGGHVFSNLAVTTTARSERWDRRSKRCENQLIWDPNRSSSNKLPDIISEGCEESY